MRHLVATLCFLALTPAGAQAPQQTPAPTATPKPLGYPSPAELKKLPLEQLVDLQITSVARRPEPLSQAASAVDVITSEDIQRSGVTNFPDALRLAPEMEVAQISGHEWAISTRGFNISTANKLQVLMDGRTLYTPLFSGVFWDVQQTFLPDVEQIEIIRGPGGTLWGADAVNGVINIRTKPANETQGFLLWGGAGNEEIGFGGIRYGGMLNADTAYRAYVTHDSRDSLTLSGGGDAHDDYQITQGGFRIDSKFTHDDLLTVQGDAYGGTFSQLNGGDVDVDGQNIIGRWSRDLGENSSLSVQAYFDRTHRFVPDVFEETRDTYDVEFQHRFWIAQHDVIYGANYRGSHDDIGNTAAVAFLPATETENLVSGYFQDEWHLVPEIFSIIGGSKFEWNSFSGFEVQPSGRFLWTPTKTQTVWGAISRAVRTPTRLDEDVVFYNAVTGTPFLIGNKSFDSEVLVAYELGYRVKATPQLSFDLAGYYNDYDNLRSVEVRDDGLLVIDNLLKAQSYGATLSSRWQATDWWRIDGSVSLFHLDVVRGNSTDVNHGRGEGNDPEASFVIHSGMDLTKGVFFDSYLRYVDNLPSPPTPAYVELDARLAWSPCKNLEVAIVGRNLLDNAHPEFASPNPAVVPTREVQRSVYATIRWSF